MTRVFVLLTYVFAFGPQWPMHTRNVTRSARKTRRVQKKVGDGNLTREGEVVVGVDIASLD